MSEQQIQQILKTLKEQNEMAELRVAEHQKTFLIIRNDIANLQSDILPIVTIFKNATGFNKISIWIMKGLAMIGTTIAALYIIIEFFKRISK